MWTKEQEEAFAKKMQNLAGRDDVDLEEHFMVYARAAAGELLTFAVELVAARGGTMTAERIADLKDSMEALAKNRPAVAEEIGEALRHMTDQGATVATLQAKVDGLNIEMAKRGAALDESLRREIDLLAEVERMKAAHEQRYASLRRAYVRWMDRANTAESRLAAIRERATDVRRIGSEAWGAHNGHTTEEKHQRSAKAVARLVLEGDAPQEAGGHMNCGPSCPGYLNSGHTHVDPDAPQEATLRWVPSVEGDRFVVDGCATCSDAECAIHPHRTRYPCSDTCTHDDAATPGHPERVKERSEAFKEVVQMHPNGSCTCAGEGTCSWCDKASASASSFDAGAEAMRAACLEAVLPVLHRLGWTDGYGPLIEVRSAIEGAAP